MKKVCLWCNKEFNAAHKYNKYCSRKCSSKGYEGTRRQKIDKNWLYDEYINRHKSINDIVKKFNLSFGTVKRRLHEFNIRTRGHSECGKRNKNWKGGKKITKDGYVYIYCPTHPCAIRGRYILEHRLVMEKSLNRYLLKRELVHHIDENRDNNNVDNLLVVSSKEHYRIHHE